MIIRDEREYVLTVDDLDKGEIFEGKFEGEQGFFIKTDETYNSGDIKCVNLSTGEICWFAVDSRVKNLMATIVIER